MHIPDGYLSPQTYLPAYALMIPCWAYASARLKKTLRLRQVPMLALAAAFSYLIMMFNVPFGSSSGHAVGAVLIAILLGPWAAVVAVSLALAVQALIFGDGGITAFAANCLNMAVVMPFAGWGVYQLITGASTNPRRRIIAAAVAGYVGVNLAALTTAIMFGIQPLIAHEGGRALYGVYPLHIAVPVMAAGHLLVFGFVEAIVTGMVVAYFLRTDPAMFTTPTKERLSPVRRTAIALGVLLLLTPLGLYLPAKLGGGTAWGEWSAEEMAQMAGYVPAGMQRLVNLWHAPLPDYAAPGMASASLATHILWYLLSGLIGGGIIALIILGFRHFFTRKDGDDLAA